jgi:hypothetical protein
MSKLEVCKSSSYSLETTNIRFLLQFQTTFYMNDEKKCEGDSYYWTAQTTDKCIRNNDGTYQIYKCNDNGNGGIDDCHLYIEMQRL